MNAHIEITLFIVAIIAVTAFGIWKTRDTGKNGKEGAAGYFLAGRSLKWWLVGFSLISANISTEQFVGMSGSAANWLGMAIASYEWIAAATLVVVGFWFLPRFLRSGLYTIPEFLQYRFDSVARLAMAIPVVITLVLVTTSSVIYSGGKFISEYYHTVPVLNDLTYVCWIIAFIAAVYVFIGGLKACAWTDLIWGGTLILSGAIVMFLAFGALSDRAPEELYETKVANSEATIEDLRDANAWQRFVLLNDGKNEEAIAVNGPNGSGGKLHMVRPKEDSDLPWTALLIGLWIPNFFYWGLNQYIVQRTLGAKSLAEGQKGIIFAATLKLMIPFLVVIPGILAYNLYNKDLHVSASQQNDTIMSSLTADKVVKVDQEFVTLKPAVALELFAHNAAASGQKEMAVPSDMPPFELAAQINALADLHVNDNKGKVAGTLKTYDYDSAFPVLVRNLIKPHPMISWFILAALAGAVISTLASMLNSASTVATMDLYSKFTGDTNSKRQVAVGRFFVVVFVIIAAIVAPMLNNFTSIFAFIQEFQGFISPGILAVFILGFFSPRTPRYFGAVGIATNVVAYGLLKWALGPWLVEKGWWYSSQMAFLDRMAICFFTVLLVGLLLTIFFPMRKAVVMPESQDIDMVSSKGAKVVGGLVIIATAALYWMFW